MADGFIDLDIEADAESLAALGFQYLTNNIEGWEPSAANLETLVLEAVSEMAAEIGVVAANVPKEVFKAFGEKLVSVFATAASPAYVTSTWTMIDNAGYTVPAGAVVSLVGADGVPVAFAVANDVIVPNGSTVTAAGGVLLTALIEGAEGNDLTGPATLVDSLVYVTNVAIVGATLGGTDAQEMDDYLNKLSLSLQLLSRHPVTEVDVELAVLTIPGVGKAYARDLHAPGTNEKTQVAIVATGGTTTLTANPLGAGAQTTTAINWNDTAATVRTKLIALSNVNDGDVIVTGGPWPGTPIVVEWTGQYAETNVAPLTATSSLTGPGAGVTITTPTPGVAATDNNEKTVTVAVATAAGEPVGSTIKATALTMLQNGREVNFVFYVIDPTYSAIAVTFTGVCTRAADAAAIEAAAEQAVADYLNPASWGGGGETGGINPVWGEMLVIRYKEIVTAIENTIGYNYTTALTIGFEGGTMGTADLTLPGSAPLPRAGTIAGTVTAP